MSGGGTGLMSGGGLSIGSGGRGKSGGDGCSIMQPSLQLPSLLSDVEADCAHEREGVAVLDHSGPHPVVEHHPAVFQAILEVHVYGG